MKTDDVFTYELSKLVKALNQLLQTNEQIIRTIEEIKAQDKAPVSVLHDLIFIEELSQKLRLSPTTLYRYVNEGHIPCSRIGNRHVFFESDIKKFLDRNYRTGPIKKKEGGGDNGK
ncbi:helix-turn-helix domain-containing protein [Albibacterium bauzanense]|uniref:Excisionase family DNA binding protein n=1 Tax=Albibacterium bauzanense TaxID=653929 RepID=A0A4R1LZD9_9SPHI|nr:helix-turn-helix domain-containing protein [Albibacterium bauzanense]TCK84956.1 excisionase family DNA binding protein [Albibacterium bauzanense]